MLQAQIFIDKDEMYKDTQLYAFIMEYLIQNDINGATSINGFMGFGTNQKLKTPNKLFSFDEQPMVIIFIDEDEKVKRVAKELSKIVNNGIIVAHKIEVF